MRNRVKGDLAASGSNSTQIYLGKVSEQEVIHWMDVLHGK
jgi:hypothetical protein